MFPVFFFFPFSRYLNCFCKSYAGNNVVVVACIPAKKAACYWFLFAPPLSDNSPAGKVLLVKLTWGPEVDLLRTWSAQRSSSWSSLTLSFLDGTFGILSYAVLVYGWKTSCSVFQDRFATWDLLWFCFGAEPKRVWWRRPVAVGPALPADGLHIRAWQGCEASGQEEAVHRLCREPRLHGWRDDWSAEIKTYDISAIYREKKTCFLASRLVCRWIRRSQSGHHDGCGASSDWLWKHRDQPLLSVAVLPASDRRHDLRVASSRWGKSFGIMPEECFCWRKGVGGCQKQTSNTSSSTKIQIFKMLTAVSVRDPGHVAVSCVHLGCDSSVGPVCRTEAQRWRLWHRRTDHAHNLRLCCGSEYSVSMMSSRWKLVRVEFPERVWTSSRAGWCWSSISLAFLMAPVTDPTSCKAIVTMAMPAWGRRSST